MVSRLFAFLIDVLTIDILFSLGSALFSLLVQLFTGHTWEVKNHQTAATVALAVFVFLYFTVPVSAVGRTFGQAIMGLKVQHTHGGEVGGWHAALRTLTFPLSILLFGVGVLMGLLRSDRRMLQDVIAGTEEIYEWDARTAQLRVLAESAPGRGSFSPPEPQTAGTSSP
jgi:uncharacterized RDD family membrane protein YckC